MSGLTSNTAQSLVSLALETARRDYGRAICVAVCDQHGFLMGFARVEGAPLRSIAIAQGKAYTAARMGVNTSAFLDRLRTENIPASAFCDDKLTPLPGGTVLKNAAGEIVGAIGISGLTAEEDQHIANAAAAIVAAN